MFKFLFFIVFLFFLLVFLLGFSLLRGLKRFLFGEGGNQRQQRTTSQSQNQTYGSQKTSSTDSYANAEEVEDPPRSWKRRRKIYSQNEGEYVDYEEVK